MVVIISKKGNEYYIEDKSHRQVFESLEQAGYYADSELYIPQENVEAVVSENDY